MRFSFYKAEVFRRHGPWRPLEVTEFAILERIDGGNNRRLLASIGSILPAETEARYYAQAVDVTMAAQLNHTDLRQTRRFILSKPYSFMDWL